MQKTEENKRLEMLFNEILPDLIDIISQKSLSRLKFEKGDLNIKIERELFSSEVTSYEEVMETKNSHPATDTKTEDELIFSDRVGRFIALHGEEGERVKEGLLVTKDQLLGFIETINLKHEVKSKINGKLKKILVKNNDIVEYMQPLVVVDVE